ncbi:MAG: HAD-IC family P-type ATPase [Syntrophales bacterium]|jgi:Ca2+-transporting ATPase|nr:HAD-IC family P-type ATPase [Syntrophales bacterium]
MNDRTDATVWWHATEIDEVLKVLETSEDGLSDSTAEERRKEKGPNSLEAEEGINPLRLLAKQVHNPLIYLLMGAMLLSFAVGHRIDAAVIAGVIILNSMLGFFQEWRAEGALEALRKMTVPHARVLRNGTSREIDAVDVVPGDVLLLETGDRVAADARLLSGDNLQADESALTGESRPSDKEPAQVPQDTPVADRGNMVWMSANITGGRGRAVVVGTGMETEMGKIAGKVRSTVRERTPLQKRLHSLSIMLGGLGIFLAAAVFGLGLLRGHGTVQMLLFSVAVAVSTIPEGLPAVISVTLALGVRRMAKRNAIIRRLPAVETLGSATVICSDKTGTITRNQMTVRTLWAGGQIIEVTGEGYNPEGALKTDNDNPVELSRPMERLLKIGLLCNNAELKKVDAEWRVDGNPSEGALLVVSRKAGFDIDDIKGHEERLAEIPFSSEKKFMATLHSRQDGKGRCIYVKGAPERILDFCTAFLKDGGTNELDEAFKKEISEVNDRFASDALRVIAGAYREVPEDYPELKEEDIERGLTLAGLWGMIDPPREESLQAVSDARKAGIHPVMITGDHAVTAEAVARKVGIVEEPQALTGRDVEGMDRSDVARSAVEGGVFARVSPAHKLKIMESLRENGHVVAMTGDGVNDAPALKGADIGIAMGMAGTEVAKEAADMVLTDDNFATIVHAIEEGRVIYSNLKRVVFFLLATNLGEILTLVGALILDLDLPLTAVMILWINLITDGACTVPLGIEPMHSDVLDQPPRNPKESIITRPMIRRMAMLTPIMAAGTLALFWFAHQKSGMEHARTVAFAAMAAFQWFQAFNARSSRQSVFSIGLFTNKWILVGLGIAVVLQFGAVHTPVGQFMFGTTGLALIDWMAIIAVSSSIWIADELLKRFRLYS